MLNGGIQFEIESGGNAELRQCVLYRSLHKCINDLFVLEFYLLLGRMNVDVDLLRIKIDKEYIEWKMIGGQHSLKSTHYRMVQIPAFDKAVIDKKVLLSSCFARCVGFAYKAANIQIIGFFFNGDQF